MRYLAVIGTGAVVALVACTPPPEVEGQMLYTEMCASCHGASGKGDGPAALSLGQPVPDLTTLRAQAGGTFPMMEVLSVIDGFTRAQHGNLTMPEFGVMMEDQPMVLMDTGDGIQSPVPRPMADIVAYLQTIQK